MRILSAYEAGRLGDAIDLTRDLIRDLLAKWEGEVRGILPAPPAGWTSASAVEVPPTRGVFADLQIDMGTRYINAEGESIELRIVLPTLDAGMKLQRDIKEASIDDQFSLPPMFFGRWESTRDPTAAHTLTVILNVRGGLHLVLRGSSGVKRDTLTKFTSRDGLTHMLSADGVGDVGTPVLGDEHWVEVQLKALCRMYASGRNSQFSYPLRTARTALVSMAQIRGRRLIDEVRVPRSAWEQDVNPICVLPVADRGSAYARSYRKGGERFVVAICLGIGDCVEHIIPEAKGIHWSAWEEVKYIGAVGRQRKSTDPRERIETEVAFPAPATRIIIFAEGFNAAAVAQRLAGNIDYGVLWESIRGG